MTAKIPDSLPWVANGDGAGSIQNSAGGRLTNQADVNERTAYIVHACNAYPALVGALKLAREFIENGIETGYIDLPDEPDPALKTLPAIRAALKAAGEAP